MNKHMHAKTIIILLCILMAAMLPSSMSFAAGDINLSQGQTVYVPIYAHIYSGIKGRPFDLAATLSIRNTDPSHRITIVSAAYYDTGGKLIKQHVDAPALLGALASTRYIITEGDSTGGSGANFIVKWKSDKLVNPPLIEAVMIGTRSGQGISFVSRGQVIAENAEK